MSVVARSDLGQFKRSALGVLTRENLPVVTFTSTTSHFDTVPSSHIWASVVERFSTGFQGERITVGYSFKRFDSGVTTLATLSSLTWSLLNNQSRVVSGPTAITYPEGEIQIDFAAYPGSGTLYRIETTAIYEPEGRTVETITSLSNFPQN